MWALGRDGAVGMGMLCCARGGQRAIYSNRFSPSTVWILEIELRSSDFPASSFYPVNHLSRPRCL